MDEFKIVYNLGWSWVFSKSKMKNPFLDNRYINETESRKFHMFELGMKHAQEFEQERTKDLR